MKTTLLLSYLLLPTMLLGQVTNHFDNVDSKWNVANTYPAASQQSPNFVATTTTVYGFQGDTLINNEQWLKLYSTSDSLFQSNLLFRGLLREKNDKIFFLDTLNQLDTLYDFSLNVGDSVLFDLYGMFPEWLQVVNVDSVQISGDYYRQLKFAEPTMNAFDELNEIWIEGIGSIHGPLFPNFPVKFSQEIPDSMLVTCTFSNNQQVWQHQSYPSCYVNIVLNVARLELSDFKIYPNPFPDRIHIENNGLQQYGLNVLNTLGQTVKQIQVNNDNQTIDLSELKAGVSSPFFRTILKWSFEVNYLVALDIEMWISLFPFLRIDLSTFQHPHNMYCLLFSFQWVFCNSEHCEVGNDCSPFCTLQSSIGIHPVF